MYLKNVDKRKLIRTNYEIFYDSTILKTRYVGILIFHEITILMMKNVVLLGDFSQFWLKMSWKNVIP